MKHPILYRIGFYSCFAIVCGAVLFLISLINEAPFSSSDMRLAYLNGCNFASRPLDDIKITECIKVADMFKETLDDLDKQMEVLDAKRKKK